MKARTASFRRSCEWLAIAAFAAAAQNGRGLPTTEDNHRSPANARIQAIRGLNGQTLTPEWRDNRRLAQSSSVSIRVDESKRGSEPGIEFLARLQSNPLRVDGPDDDRSGANPEEVRLRAISLTQGKRVIREFDQFQSWYEEDDDRSMAASSGVLYCAASREYTPGRPGPAYFVSRSLTRVPLSLLASALDDNAAGQRGEPIRLELRTDAGTLSVELPLARRQAVRNAEPQTLAPAAARVDVRTDSTELMSPWE